LRRSEIVEVIDRWIARAPAKQYLLVEIARREHHRVAVVANRIGLASDHEEASPLLSSGGTDETEPE
jgi:hypothetical protein